jgi:hypothetical protein
VVLKIIFVIAVGDSAKNFKAKEYNFCLVLNIIFLSAVGGGGNKI